ncbi:MAG: VOC family protein [Candidatus Acidiferrum sp.]
MLKTAVPLLHIYNAAAAIEFYCGGLGFHLEFAHRPDGATTDPCYMGVTRVGVWLNLSSFSGDGISGGVANLFTDDVDGLHAEFASKNVPIAVGPVDRTWGTREMYVKDADGNSLRFIQP